MSKLIKLTVHKNDKYVTISLHAVENKHLSWKAKGLHLYLMSRPPNWQIRFKDLIRRSLDGHASLNTSIKDLAKNGYLTIKKVRIKGQFAGTEWEVFEEPEESKNDAAVPANKGVSPQVQNPHVVKPFTENGSTIIKHTNIAKTITDFDKTLERIESELIK